MDTSEQPDTAKGKKMAQATMTENEKTIIISVFAGLLLVAGWAGYASILGFLGRVEMTNFANITLASIAGIAIATMVAGVVTIRKR